MRRRRDDWPKSGVASRPWTRAERRVVLRGFFGRLTVAVEPLIAAIFFAVLPLLLFLRKQEIVAFLAPIFAFAALAFFVYAVALMVPSTRAVLGTFSPIYVVDGYVRYRTAENAHPKHYVAVLNSERRQLGEWPLREWPPSIGRRELWPVLVEFSEFGGIHKIDGRSTGVLPDEIAPFGVGVAQDDRRRKSPFS